MDMTFNNESEAYEFYNSYARDRGFSIRKNKTKRRKGPLTEVCRRRFVCSREGVRDPRLLTMENRTRRLRPETRCKCKAELAVASIVKPAFGA